MSHVFLNDDTEVAGGLPSPAAFLFHEYEKRLQEAQRNLDFHLKQIRYNYHTQFALRETLKRDDLTASQIAGIKEAMKVNSDQDMEWHKEKSEGLRQEIRLLEAMIAAAVKMTGEVA